MSNITVVVVIDNTRTEIEVSPNFPVIDFEINGRWFRVYRY